jgi:alanine racemase
MTSNALNHDTPAIGPAHLGLDGVTGLITIDLRRIASNWQALAASVGPAECGAVVKADAYGLGADQIVPALLAAGCQTFFVATVDEAEQVRAMAPRAVLYVLDGLVAGSGPRLADIGARPALATLDDCLEWAALCAARDRILAAALHIDTGLNRLGLSANDVALLAADPSLFNRIGVTLIMSHLACADHHDDPKNNEQRATFELLRALLPAAPASLAASDGLLLGAPYHYQLVRPGYAIYGGQVSLDDHAPVAPAVRVEARVLQIREIPAGDSVGYATTWRAQRPSLIATIAAGYADGTARAASATNSQSGGQVSFKGRLAPIVGRVSMDLITVDVTALGEGAPKRGDFVDLIGPSLTIEDVGAGSQTIGYEVLTRLSRRFQRRYITSTAAQT